jgi:hypothetical protein
VIGVPHAPSRGGGGEGDNSGSNEEGEETHRSPNTKENSTNRVSTSDAAMREVLHGMTPASTVEAVVYRLPYESIDLSDAKAIETFAKFADKLKL